MLHVQCCPPGAGWDVVSTCKICVTRVLPHTKTSTESLLWSRETHKPRATGKRERKESVSRFTRACPVGFPALPPCTARNGACPNRADKSTFRARGQAQAAP